MVPKNLLFLRIIGLAGIVTLVLLFIDTQLVKHSRAADWLNGTKNYNLRDDKLLKANATITVEDENVETHMETLEREALPLVNLLDKHPEWQFPRMNTSHLVQWRLDLEAKHPTKHVNCSVDPNRTCPDQILLLTASDYRNRWQIPDLDDHVEFNRRLYAFLHGYKFKVFDLAKLIEDKHLEESIKDQDRLEWEIIWAARRSKSEIVSKGLKEFPEAEWIWWLDLDAIIVDIEIPLDLYLLNSEALEEKVQLDHEYVRFWDKLPETPVRSPNTFNYTDTQFIINEDFNMMNSGSVFFRRGVFLDILLELWSDYVLNRMVDLPLEDQGILAYILFYHDEFLSRTVTVHAQWINQYRYFYNDNFLVHFAGCQPMECNNEFDQFLDKIANMIYASRNLERNSDQQRDYDEKLERRRKQEEENRERERKEKEEEEHAKLEEEKRLQELMAEDYKNKENERKEIEASLQ